MQRARRGTGAEGGSIEIGGLACDRLVTPHLAPRPSPPAPSTPPSPWSPPILGLSSLRRTGARATFGTSPGSPCSTCGPAHKQQPPPAPLARMCAVRCRADAEHASHRRSMPHAGGAPAPANNARRRASPVVTHTHALLRSFATVSLINSGALIKTAVESNGVKVYAVNSAAASSSSSLLDWHTRKCAAKGRGERAAQFAIAMGTYKPQVRVSDLAQLTLKFGRHLGAENVDFVILSDHWTKSIHLQNDRTIEVHAQGGFHYRMRIPRFGRALAHHLPSCDALFSTAGNEIYRLNLGQGHFMTPPVLTDEEEILGVDTIDVNPRISWWPLASRALGPRSFGIPGPGSIPSRVDGLSYALGTSTGHTLLYDIRAGQPFALKDQGYGLPVKNVPWIEGGSRMAGDGMVLSADRKVIKIWDRNSMPLDQLRGDNTCRGLESRPPCPGQRSHHEQLGPAPRWASFLENITEEMEDQTTRSVYEDYKFVERSELTILRLDHLVSTPTLKPHMRRHFLSLKLYDAARIIANPFAYTEYREKVVRERMEKLVETRIRTKKDGSAGVKINKALAEKILRDQEREVKRLEKRKVRGGQGGQAYRWRQGDGGGRARARAAAESAHGSPFREGVPGSGVHGRRDLTRICTAQPSAAAQRRNGSDVRRKTAVEEEEEESDKVSSDGLGDGSNDDSDGESGSGSDSSDAGALSKFDPRVRPGQKNARAQEAYSHTREQNRLANKVKFVPMRPASTGANDVETGYALQYALYTIGL
ncbi:hypothetical protein FB451DRAFT_1470351 [Mycena latifolia]|nr:hypothetical protein FB451DRAFT_1470351 [Mycena latifolia]